MVTATNPSSICCVYKETIVKRTHTEDEASIKIQKVATFDLDRKKINLIPNKSI